MKEKQLANILQLYDKQQTFKIADFLTSEIDKDNLQDTIDFVVSDDTSKNSNFKDELYEGDEYEGIFLEGNQYLLASSEGEVTIIDMISEDHGVSVKDTRVKFTEESFIILITNKEETLDWIKKYRADK
ncbi:hypothetical protein [Enterococcus mundtii]|uniref:Uncharacterized protein n=1 Tax=Enterococcus mundtii TaxID=53346 RepID=A0A2T5DET2_ENTMU|nr:hypothetical protein [Enterococcus mundtii]MBE6172229.1 hypothetical protein [Enterococcus faecium]MBO1086991.1 hypothetical protein [Enterococcus mundtii]MDV7745096.1 hypothetical protein [Enterococcus mundtii]PTO36507.1 hypothetical protein C6N14_03710 [Enterococcus mundtii]